MTLTEEQEVANAADSRLVDYDPFTGEEVVFHSDSRLRREVVAKWEARAEVWKSRETLASREAAALTRAGEDSWWADVAEGRANRSWRRCLTLADAYEKGRAIR